MTKAIDVGVALPDFAFSGVFNLSAVPHGRSLAKGAGASQEDRDQATPAGTNRPPGTPAGTERTRERESREQGSKGAREQFSESASLQITRVRRRRLWGLERFRFKCLHIRTRRRSLNTHLV